MGRQPPKEVIDAAQAADRQWHIPASVQIAQWALESGWGEHVPPGSFNPFGIKAKIGEPVCLAATKEVLDGNVVSIRAGFRKFASLADAFDHHARLIATNAIYAKARACLPDINAFCYALGGSTSMHPTYATDPNYGAKLMAVIDGSNLQAFD